MLSCPSHRSYRSCLTLLLATLILGCGSSPGDVPLSVQISLPARLTIPINELDMTITKAPGSAFSFTKSFLVPDAAPLPAPAPPAPPVSFAPQVGLTINVPANTGFLMVCVDGKTIGQPAAVHGCGMTTIAASATSLSVNLKALLLPDAGL